MEYIKWYAHHAVCIKLDKLRGRKGHSVICYICHMHLDMLNILVFPSLHAVSIEDAITIISVNIWCKKDDWDAACLIAGLF